MMLHRSVLFIDEKAIKCHENLFRADKDNLKRCGSKFYLLKIILIE